MNSLCASGWSLQSHKARKNRKNQKETMQANRHKSFSFLNIFLGDPEEVMVAPVVF